MKTQPFGRHIHLLHNKVVPPGLQPNLCPLTPLSCIFPFDVYNIFNVYFGCFYEITTRHFLFSILYFYFLNNKRHFFILLITKTWNMRIRLHQLGPHQSINAKNKRTNNHCIYSSQMALFGSGETIGVHNIYGRLIKR